MDTAVQTPTRQRIILATAGALAYAAAFRSDDFAWAAWLVPVFWLGALAGTRPRVGLRLAHWGGFAACALSLTWLWSVFGMGALALWMIPALYVAAWGLLVASLSPALGAARHVLPAVAWCGLEYLRGEVAPLEFAWVTLGASQQNLMGSLLAPLVGSYGISFLMFLWGGMLLGTLRAARPFLMLGLLPVLVLAAVPVPEWNGSSLGTVRLLQTTETFDVMDLPPPSGSSVVDLEIWPEYSFFLDPEAPGNGWILEQLRPHAATTRWGLVFGGIRVPEGLNREEGFENTAFVLSPSGDLAGGAVKNRPVPFFRDGTPAKTITTIRILRPGAGTLNAGVGVCFDGSYERFARRMAASGAEILIFPTMNLGHWGALQQDQHRRLFQMRAMETGRPVLVAANAGPTFVASPTGSATRPLPFNRVAQTVAEIPAPAGHKTFYVQVGWLLGPISLAWTAVVALQILLLNRRRARPASQLSTRHGP